MAARTEKPGMMDRVGSWAKGALETVSTLPRKMVDAFRGGFKKRMLQASVVAAASQACTVDQICDARAARVRDEYTAGIDSFETFARMLDYVYGEIGTPNTPNSQRQVVCQLRENEEYYMMPMGTDPVRYIHEDELEEANPNVYGIGQGYGLVRRDDPRVVWVDDHDDNPRKDFANIDIAGVGLPNQFGLDLTQFGYAVPDGASSELLPVDIFFGTEDLRAVAPFMDPNVPEQAQVWVRFNLFNGRNFVPPEDAYFAFIGDGFSIVGDGDENPLHTMSFPNASSFTAIVVRD